MKLVSFPHASSLQQDHPRAEQVLKKRERQQVLTYWSMVGPLLLGLTVFTFLPILWSIILSFADARSTVTPTSFVGLSNYISLLSDDTFRKTLLTGILFALFIIPTTFCIALALAL